MQVDVAAERQRQPGDTGALEPDLNLCTRKPAALALALRSIAAARVFARCGGCPPCPRERRALFFGEIVRRIGLLPSRVENAIAELAANGWVTSDSFEGLRALLVPDDKRQPFTHSRPRKHHRAVTSIEFAGRWSAVRSLIGMFLNARNHSRSMRERSCAATALSSGECSRESLRVPWFELLRIYRQLEARGEIRGGYFVSGVSGEQFALPEAVGLLRSIRRTRAREGKQSPSELITISAADPLNLVGVLSPGPRIAAITAHRILLRDGVPSPLSRLVN